MGCTLAKPIVDGIEKEFGDRLRVIRVDIQTSAGQEIARQFNSPVTPTFIFFAADGEEAWRMIGQIDTQRIREFVQ